MASNPWDESPVKQRRWLHASITATRCCRSMGVLFHAVSCLVFVRAHGYGCVWNHLHCRYYHTSSWPSMLGSLAMHLACCHQSPSWHLPKPCRMADESHPNGVRSLGVDWNVYTIVVIGVFTWYNVSYNYTATLLHPGYTQQKVGCHCAARDNHQHLDTFPCQTFGFWNWVWFWGIRFFSWPARYHFISGYTAKVAGTEAGWPDSEVGNSLEMNNNMPYQVMLNVPVTSSCIELWKAV